MKAKTIIAKRLVLCLNCGHLYLSRVPRPKCGNCGARRFASQAEEIKAEIQRLDLLREKLEGGLRFIMGAGSMP